MCAHLLKHDRIELLSGLYKEAAIGTPVVTFCCDEDGGRGTCERGEEGAALTANGDILRYMP